MLNLKKKRRYGKWINYWYTFKKKLKDVIHPKSREEGENAYTGTGRHFEILFLKGVLTLRTMEDKFIEETDPV